MSNPIPVPAADRAAFARRIAELRTQAPSGSNYAVGLYGALEADFETLAHDARHGLLGTSLAWSEEQRREAAWLRHASEDLAHLGYTLCEAQGPARGEGDARIRGLMARTLQHMGDTVKWAVAVTREVPHDFGKPNAIMRAAIAGAQHRIALRMRFVFFRRLARSMEPRAATPGKRIDAIRQLTQAGVPVTVMFAPCIPGLNDHEMEAVLQSAAEAGASGAGYVALRLPREIKDLFREWLESDHPDRARRVMSLVRQMRGGKENDPSFGSRMTGTGNYAELIEKHIAQTSFASRQPMPMRR